MAEPPVRDSTGEVDARYTRLLTAARLWRAGLIPKTSSAALGAVTQLLNAVGEFDPEHPPID